MTESQKRHRQYRVGFVAGLAYLVVLAFSSFAALILSEAPGTLVEKAMDVIWATIYSTLTLVGLGLVLVLRDQARKVLTKLWHQFDTFKLM